MTTIANPCLLPEAAAELAAQHWAIPRSTESVAMMDGPTYDSAEVAEAEGLAWASANKVAQLYVATPM